MREIDRLCRELTATVDGDPWYGTAVFRLLEGVDAKTAAAHPIDGAHSIWELVLHMTSWANEARRRLRGTAHADPVEGDWPAVGPDGADAWQAALSGLRQAHAALAQALAAIADGDLDRQIAGPQVNASGEPVTFHDTIAGILQHDAYHAGQIALLKKHARR